jgi:hypothetical protein
VLADTDAIMEQTLRSWCRTEFIPLLPHDLHCRSIGTE